MSSVRAQKQFDRISNAVGVSEAGKAWLMASIDPFHDEPIHGLCGLPDGSQSNSVVQVIRQTLQVSCPASVTSGTWDCHIQSLPIMDDTFSYQGDTFYTSSDPNATGIPAVVASHATNGVYLGPINVTSGASTLSEVQCFSPNSSLVHNKISVPSNYTSGAFRLIAKGWEVISSGPSLYRSGTVYSYQLPAPDSQASQTVMTVGKGISDYSVLYQSAKFFNDLPNNAHDANLIPNCMSWEAKDGVYVVDRMSNVDQCTFAGAGAMLVYQTNIAVPADNATDGATILNAYAANLVGFQFTSGFKFGGFPGTYTQVVANKYASTNYTQFNHSGSYFTGLSLQDTLTINAIFYIERLPGSDNPDLLVLARPTPPMDQQALEMYSLIMSEMPPAMVQKANGFGDWFRDAVSTVVDNVAPALGALPGPLGLIGKAVTVGGGLVKSILPRDEPVIPAPNTYIENPRQEVRNEIKRELNTNRKKKSQALSTILSAAIPKKKKKNKMKKAIKKDISKDLRKDLKKLRL